MARRWDSPKSNSTFLGLRSGTVLEYRLMVSFVHHFRLSLVLRAAVFSAFIMTLTTSCTTLKQWIPALRETPVAFVELGFQDRAAQMVVLIRDLELPVTIANQGSMPYTQNSHALLIVGNDFPFDKLVEILSYARNYYTDLHYVKVTDPADSRSLYTDHARLYIGAPSDEAVAARLTPWTDADFNQLRAVKSQNEMITLIRAKSKPQPTK